MLLNYQLKSNKKSRKISIRVGRDGGGEVVVVVTKPARVRVRDVESVVAGKMDWINNAVARMKARPKKLLAHHTKADYQKNKKKYLEKAHELVCSRLDYYNKFYNFEINKITIRNQSSRWGSCSQKGNLNFNYKIIFLPSPLADYLVVHELCHLAQMNHSIKFWDLVGKCVPDYKTRRRELKRM